MKRKSHLWVSRREKRVRARRCLGSVALRYHRELCRIERVLIATHPYEVRRFGPYPKTGVVSFCDWLQAVGSWRFRIRVLESPARPWHLDMWRELEPKRALEHFRKRPDRLDVLTRLR